MIHSFYKNSDIPFLILEQIIEKKKKKKTIFGFVFSVKMKWIERHMDCLSNPFTSLSILFFIPKMKKKIHLFCFSIICSNIEKRKMEFCFLISFIEREDHYFSLNNYLIKHFFKFQKNHDFQSLYWTRKLLTKNWSSNINF